jgi:hypothetical protein
MDKKNYYLKFIIITLSVGDKGWMLWPRLNEKDQDLRIHACNTLPVAYQNFTELSAASVSQ